MINFIAALSAMSGGCRAAKTPSIQDTSQPQAENRHQQPSANQAIKYENIVSGRAETADGTPFSFQSYKSADGVPISTRVERRNSAARAEKELLRNMNAAVKILEQGPKLDVSGRKIGKRVVLTTKQEGSTKLQTTVLWTEGSQLHFIESPSLQHALEFEKWYSQNP